MTKLHDRLLALIVLGPALFWLLIYMILRNKNEVLYLTGFIAFLIDEIKGIKQDIPKRIYP